MINFEPKISGVRVTGSEIDEVLNISEEACKRNGWTWGLNIFGLDEVEQSENGKVFVTAPI